MMGDSIEIKPRYVSQSNDSGNNEHKSSREVRQESKQKEGTFISKTIDFIKKYKLIIIIAVLVIMVIGLTWQVFDSIKKQKELKESYKEYTGKDPEKVQEKSPGKSPEKPPDNIPPAMNNPPANIPQARPVYDSKPNDNKSIDNKKTSEGTETKLNNLLEKARQNQANLLSDNTNKDMPDDEDTEGDIEYDPEELESEQSKE